GFGSRRSRRAEPGGHLAPPDDAADAQFAPGSARGTAGRGDPGPVHAFRLGLRRRALAGPQHTPGTVVDAAAMSVPCTHPNTHPEYAPPHASPRGAELFRMSTP